MRGGYVILFVGIGLLIVGSAITLTSVLTFSREVAKNHVFGGTFSIDPHNQVDTMLDISDTDQPFYVAIGSDERKVPLHVEVMDPSRDRVVSSDFASTHEILKVDTTEPGSYLLIVENSGNETTDVEVRVGYIPLPLDETDLGQIPITGGIAVGITILIAGFGTLITGIVIVIVIKRREKNSLGTGQ